MSSRRPRSYSNDPWAFQQAFASSRNQSIPRENFLRTPYKSEFTINGHLLKPPTHQDPGMLRTRRDQAQLGGQQPGEYSGGRHAHRHKDLKRKLVFNLHNEIRKPIHTIVLEEISDIDRITEICLGTLKAMMDHKVHRRYLHHMNNNNNVHLAQPGTDYTANAGNSASQGETSGSKKKGKVRKDSKTVTDLPDSKGLPPAFLKQLQRQDEAFKRVSIAVKQNKRASEMITTVVRRNSAGSEARRDSHYTVLPSGKEGEEDDDAPDRFSTSQAFRDKARLLTPKEALNCKWLRLNASQVKELENYLIARGEDPGIHAHKNVENFDVFSEIREIRKSDTRKTEAIPEDDEELMVEVELT